MNYIKKYTTGALLVGALLATTAVSAQQTPAPPLVTQAPPKNWHLLDLATDGYFGISLNQAYAFVKNKKSKTVLVAIIDSGADSLQKDLQGVLWQNPKEIPNNGKDDDGDGYIDDVHGWDFLGGPGGKADVNETSEEVREYARLKPKYESLTQAPAGDAKGYNFWLKVKAMHDSTVTKSTNDLKEANYEMNVLMVTNGYVKKALGLGANGTFTAKDLDKINATSDTLTQSKTIWNLILTQEGADATNEKVFKDLNEYTQKLNADVNPDLNSRKNIVGDDPEVWSSNYGNNFITQSDASHGTGVAGLIGAKRGNGYGIDGVADNVNIMVIKAVPNGDENDKDIANGIFFAVNHGAKVINMSFGKKLSPHKEWVDSAFRYAAAHDVLLVHASGNDNQDIDAQPDFPNNVYLDGTVDDDIINVGASGSRRDTSLAGDFSNYGQKGVDLFAPGVKVTSIDLNAEFNTADGTSFASPIVTGIAALILEYYPKLSSLQVKQAILESVTPVKGLMVNKPGTHTLVDFATLSKTGGIANAYKALQIASKMKGERK